VSTFSLHLIAKDLGGNNPSEEKFRLDKRLAVAAKFTYTENGDCGVYSVMKRKFKIIGICAMLALVAAFEFLSRDGRRRAIQATKSQLVIAPDGTIKVPQNDGDYVKQLTIDVAKATTNDSPATMPPGKK